jgi:hypothetical protein
MTDEVKADLDDTKDFAHQAGLEAKIQGRHAKKNAMLKAGKAAQAMGKTNKQKENTKQKPNQLAAWLFLPCLCFVALF